MFFKLVGKDKKRSLTTITWAIPVIVFSSYGLYRRLVLGEERRPTPDIWAPFTPVEGAPTLDQAETEKPLLRADLAKRPFEK